MKKVLHIVISANYREGDSYQENVLSEQHKRLGYDVYVIAKQRFKDREGNISYLPLGKYVNKHDIKVTVLPCTKHNPRYQMFFNICEGLYQAIEEIQPDIIFTHNFTTPDIRQIVKYVRKHPEVKSYVDCHSDYFNTPIKSLWSRVNTICIRRNAHLLNKVSVKFWGTTPWRVDYLKDVYKVPANKTDLLIMGASEEYIVNRNVQEIRRVIRNKYGVPENAFLVITGGTLDKRKNQIALLKAVKNLGPEVWLLVFGRPTEEMKPEFDRYNDIKNIIQTGWIPSENAYDLFIASDLAFFPGTHSVLWEQAAACGIPVVVKHWSGMEHINVNGNAVFLEKADSDTIERTIVNIKEKSYSALKQKAEESASSFYASNNARKAIGDE